MMMNLNGAEMFRSTAFRNVLSSLALKRRILCELPESGQESLHAHVHRELPRSSHRWRPLFRQFCLVPRALGMEEGRRRPPASVTKLLGGARQARVVRQRSREREEEPNGMLLSLAKRFFSETLVIKPSHVLPDENRKAPGD